MSYSNRVLPLSEVGEEFNRRYPFLKISFPDFRRPYLKVAGGNQTFLPDDLARQLAARDILEKEIAISDSMTVLQLEAAINDRLGVSIQLFRKSGKNWIETSMTRDWTLQQQNEMGRDLSTGFK